MHSLRVISKAFSQTCPVIAKATSLISDFPMDCFLMLDKPKSLASAVMALVTGIVMQF